ncbi:kelch domain-containing protein 7B [Ornithorhynchus anatinus]|uniref:kelch domain-containing protein 7B n=1 Tax=Ornithorhynchus anatinus TaxID=9258 RepID=UPI0010A85692|nr:kelch domain-containing protein 7B [Ornithorhynchus anatinus]
MTSNVSDADGPGDGGSAVVTAAQTLLALAILAATALAFRWLGLGQAPGAAAAAAAARTAGERGPEAGRAKAAQERRPAGEVAGRGRGRPAEVTAGTRTDRAGRGRSPERPGSGVGDSPPKASAKVARREGANEQAFPRRGDGGVQGSPPADPCLQTVGDGKGPPPLPLSPPPSSLDDSGPGNRIWDARREAESEDGGRGRDRDRGRVVCAKTQADPGREGAGEPDPGSGTGRPGEEGAGVRRPPSGPGPLPPLSSEPLSIPAGGRKLSMCAIAENPELRVRQAAAGPAPPAAPAPAPAPARLDLGGCLEALARARKQRRPELAAEAYAVMSDNLLRVLSDAPLYRRLGGAERERILALRTARGRPVLGVLPLPGGPGPGPRPEPPAQLHVLDPDAAAWRPLTPVPAEAPLRGCGLCTLHNYLFLAGGVRGSGPGAVCSDRVFCYNPLTGIWSQLRPMRQARAQLKLVGLDGLLYAIGGECLYTVERYDPRTDSWAFRAPLPAGTFPVAHEAVACRGDIYVTGGHLFYRLLRYRPGPDAWEECPYSASHRRSSAIVALGGFLYRFDPLRGVGAAVLRFNTVTRSWSQATPLPLPPAPAPRDPPPPPRDPAPLRCAVLGGAIYCLNAQLTARLSLADGAARFQEDERLPAFSPAARASLNPFVLTLPSPTPLQTPL